MSDCNRSGITTRSNPNPGNAGKIFCNPRDCGWMVDSMQSICNPAIYPKSGLWFCNPSNRTNNRLNQHNRTGLHLDCKTTEDYKTVDRIVSTSWEIHNPFEPFAIRFWILCNPNAIKTDCALIGPDVTELQLDSRMCPANPDKGSLQSCHNQNELRRDCQNPGNAGTIFCNPGDCGCIVYVRGNPFAILYNPIGLRLDCKTTKDCQRIEKIATKSWEIHELQANLPQLSKNWHLIAICRGSQRNPTKTLAMPAQSFAILGIAIGL